MDDCRVFRFFDLFGKKWTYPLIYCLKPNKHYSFNNIVKLSRVKINRTLLSNTLKELIELEILTKKGKDYMLAPKGEEVKRLFLEIKSMLFEGHDEPYCPDDCPIMLFKF